MSTFRSLTTIKIFQSQNQDYKFYDDLQKITVMNFINL